MLPTQWQTVCYALCQTEFESAIYSVMSPQLRSPGNIPHMLTQDDKKLLVLSLGSTGETTECLQK